MHIYLLSLLLILAPITTVGQTTSERPDSTKAAARKVFEANHDKVYGVKTLTKMEIEMQGRQVPGREIPAYGIGTVIAEDMLVASYRAIKPSPNLQRLSQAQAQSISISTEVKEIKLVDSSGEEFDAKLVLHDEDLDLAFIAVDKKGENADSWSCSPINIDEDVELQHLDEAVFLSRANESLRFQPSIRLGQVTTVIKRPRKLYSTDSMILSGAAFNLDGQYVGMGIRKKSGSGVEFSVILPAKYIRKLLPQAIEKANSMESDEIAENSDATDEPVEEKESGEESSKEVDDSDDGK